MKIQSSIPIPVIIPHIAHIHQLSNTKDTITQAKPERKNDIYYELRAAFKRTITYH
jgi:hypothetical protein